jgi:hypothetical protein
MAKGFILKCMVKNMMDNGKMVEKVEKVFSITQMEEFMMVIGLTIKCKVLEF